MTDDRHAAGPDPAAFPSVEPASSPEPRPAASLRIEGIRARRDFLAANSGTRVPMPPFILLVKPTSLGTARVGFTVSRRVGNAVARNRAKRRLREVARLTMPELAIPSADHIFIARPQDAELAFDELLATARKALKKAGQRLQAANADPRHGVAR